MKGEKEVQKLLKNISDSIGKTSIEELNSNLSNYLLTKNDRNGDINIVLKDVSDDFGITIKSLMDKNVRGLIQDAKQTAYYILHCGLNLSIGYISSNIFSNNKASVWIGIKRYKQANMKILQEKEFVERVDRLKEAIMQKIKNQ
jgi:hypothetical protein